MVDSDVLAELPLPELVAQSRALAAELSSRLADPRLADRLPRVPQGSAVDRSDDWGLYAHADRAAPEAGGFEDALVIDRELNSHDGADSTRSENVTGSLPELQLGVEALARAIDSARTALAGHTDRIFEAHHLREELLGIPPGKCAFRNGAEYLRTLLRIDRREAKALLARATHTMASLTLDRTTVIPAVMPVLAEAVQTAEMGEAAVDMIVGTIASAHREAVLANTAPGTVGDLLADGERLLVAQARDLDPDTLRRVCAHWRQRFEAVVNPDGSEPTDAQLKATQGLFYRGPGKGLHQWTLLASDAQHEVLTTVVCAASSPRKTRSDCRMDLTGRHQDRTGTTGTEEEDGAPELAVNETLDGRSRAQRELDGLVSALTGALALVGIGPETGVGADGRGIGNTNPAGGAQPGPRVRARPQIMAVIDYETLIARFGAAADAHTAERTARRGSTGSSRLPDPAGPAGPPVPPGPPGPPGLSSPSGPRDRTISTTSYVGDINPQTIRQLTCEADLIPVVLGGSGEVLDVGRSKRLFTPQLRRAITARDGGCTAPGCSIPAPWCEAHHIHHWEDGGPTSVENGALLCSHHHHAVHAGAWEISVRRGVPWFVPARYLDPERRPRRNFYWRPGLAA
ncbi:HNH endonuclease signature motif containing protein [Citricoccus sp.]|uniref:HNH endonuclease signature motif containing protein n=1 Tax=Citricoccus sp. TaxID=1978372 RepID=UPI0028BE8DCF|nr:HNH endonuclease signature motif containing protein [Citricoccus sp.]